MAEADDARVAADDIEATEVSDNVIHQPGDLRDAPHVRLHGDGLGAKGLDLRDDLLGRLAGVGVVDHHLGAVATQLNGHRSTNTTARASHESDLAVQAVGHVGGSGVGTHCAGCLVKRLVY